MECRLIQLQKKPLALFIILLSVLLLVVGLTYGILKMQFNEAKISSYIEQAMLENFPEYKSSITKVDFSISTKFRYKIDEIKFEPNLTNLEAVPFKTLRLLGVSIKLPLFFFLGKQDIQIYAEKILIDDPKFSILKKNHFSLININKSQRIFKWPRFLTENRVNVILENIQFASPQETSTFKSIPFVSMIKRLVIKNFGIKNKSAVELIFPLSLGPKNQNLFWIQGIGEISWDSFFTKVNPEFKMHFEIKQILLPELQFLQGMRFEVVPTREKRTYSDLDWKVKSSFFQGEFQSSISDQYWQVQNISGRVLSNEWTNELPRWRAVLGFAQTLLDYSQLMTTTWDIKGDSIYDSQLDQWLPNLVVTVNGEESRQLKWLIKAFEKVTSPTVDPIRKGLVTELKKKEIVYQHEWFIGDDGAGKRFTMSCLYFFCENSVTELSLTYDRATIDSKKSQSIESIKETILDWWKFLPVILSEKNYSYFDINFKNLRWNEWEFDLKAKINLLKDSLLATSIEIKSSGKESIKSNISVSFENSEPHFVFIGEFTDFPASLLGRFLNASQLQVSGNVNGRLTIDWITAKNFNFDLKILDGEIQWLNLQTILDRENYLKPEDEKYYPLLKWQNAFQVLSIIGIINENQKQISAQFKYNKSKVVKRIEINRDLVNNRWELNQKIQNLPLKTQNYFLKTKTKSMPLLFSEDKDQFNEDTLRKIEKK